jgi:molecular chaperone GrpE
MKDEIKNNSEQEKTNNTSINEEIDKSINKEKQKPEDKNLTKDEKIKDLEEKLVRSLAEMENQRRRFEKEKEDAFDFGGFAFARESLLLIDNLDRAKISISNNEIFKKNNELSKILETFDVVQKDLISIFKRNGIELINCLNKKFDPNYHQAMLEIEDENKEPGIIVQEIQKGFTMKGRLLRPSLVGVTKKKDNEKKGDKNSTKNELNDNEKNEENSEKN